MRINPRRVLEQRLVHLVDIAQREIGSLRTKEGRGALGESCSQRLCEKVLWEDRLVNL